MQLCNIIFPYKYCLHTLRSLLSQIFWFIYHSVSTKREIKKVLVAHRLWHWKPTVPLCRRRAASKKMSFARFKDDFPALMLRLGGRRKVCTSQLFTILMTNRKKQWKVQPQPNKPVFVTNLTRRGDGRYTKRKVSPYALVCSAEKTNLSPRFIRKKTFLTSFSINISGFIFYLDMNI